jgi:hypothetical protein
LDSKAVLTFCVVPDWTTSKHGAMTNKPTLRGF